MTLRKNGTRDSVHLTFLPLENDHFNIGSKMEMLCFEFWPESTSESVEFYWKFRDSMMSLTLYTDMIGDDVKEKRHEIFCSFDVFTT